MRVPDNVRRILSPIMGDVSWDRVDLRMEDLSGYAMTVPMTYAWALTRGLKRVTGLQRASRAVVQPLRTVGMTIGEHIYLDKHYADLKTAAGLSLLAHEWVHVEQSWQIPNFDALYEAEMANTDPARPWENRYEYPAYRREQQVYCQLVAMGVPPGKWLPLGVQLWGCS